MNLVTYPVISDKLHQRYEFLSEGPVGTVKKIVIYQRIGDRVYNLSFGDWNEVKQQIDDRVRTNNNDREKVLATIALTLRRFMSYYPGAVVFAKGSTPSRTRLYQIAISGSWNIINQLFIIEGWFNNRWESFKPGRNYEAFLVQSK